MQFLTPNATEVAESLNANNLQYKDDIDLKIIEDSKLVGFIISTETPVRFVGVLDFGCHGSAFDEYRLHLGLESLEFVYNDETFKIPNPTITEATDIQPYIRNNDNFIIFPDTTMDVDFTGGIFDPSITIDFGPEVIFNGFTSIEATKMVANVTASSNLQSPYPIVVTRRSVKHYGNSPTMEVSDNVIGTGSSGTFLTDFTAGGTGQSAWGNNWQLAIEGGIDSLDGFFKTSSSTTPSSRTGPKSAYDGNYMFTERSGCNSGIGKNGYALTSNFRDLTEVKFMIHMYGSGFGDVALQSQDLDGVWTERWIQSGKLQSSQSDPFIQIVQDATSWNCKAIRFVFSNTTSYSADAALDNIEITSI